MGLDVVEHGEVAAHTVERQRLVAIGRSTRRQHVVFGTGPPDADEILHREADVHRFLDRHLVHHAPAPHDHVVGLFAADLQPLGFLFLAGVIHRHFGELEAMLFRQFLQGADRLFAVRGVVVDQSDFLALQVTAVFSQQIVDRTRGTVPVVRRIVERVLNTHHSPPMSGHSPWCASECHLRWSWGSAGR